MIRKALCGLAALTVFLAGCGRQTKLERASKATKETPKS